MKTDSKKAVEPMELLEETFHLLRTAPAEVWLWHVAGVTPFFFALWHYVMDMGSNVHALEHSLTGAGVVTGAYFWMKGFQTVFARKLYMHAGGEDLKPWSRARWLRMVVIQIAFQAFSTVMILLAFLITIPFAWVFAFFHAITLYGDGNHSPKEAVRQSIRMSFLWTRMNWTGLTVLYLIGILILFNLYSCVVVIPYLLKMLTGIETEFTRNPAVLRSFPVLMLVGGLTYAVYNPIVRAFYILRCFYGESLSTGLDLRVDLKRARRRQSLMGVACILGMLLPFQVSGQKEDAHLPVASKSQGVDPEMLDQRIQEVLKRDEFSWKFPRKKEDVSAKKTPGFWDHFFKYLKESISKSMAWVIFQMERLREIFGGKHSSSGNGREPVNWKSNARWMLALLAFLVLILRGWLWWKRKQLKVIRLAPSARGLPMVPDLNQEEILASELKSDEWRKLAEELMARGDYRLALRAVFLSLLSELDQESIITVARAKSNREYLMEAGRRARERTGLIQGFQGMIGVFEKTWYGRMDVTPEHLTQYLRERDRLKHV